MTVSSGGRCCGSNHALVSTLIPPDGSHVPEHTEFTCLHWARLQNPKLAQGKARFYGNMTPDRVFLFSLPMRSEHPTCPNPILFIGNKRSREPSSRRTQSGTHHGQPQSGSKEAGHYYKLRRKQKGREEINHGRENSNQKRPPIRNKQKRQKYPVLLGIEN